MKNIFIDIKALLSLYAKWIDEKLFFFFFFCSFLMLERDDKRLRNRKNKHSVIEGEKELTVKRPLVRELASISQFANSVLSFVTVGLLITIPHSLLRSPLFSTTLPIPLWLPRCVSNSRLFALARTLSTTSRLLFLSPLCVYT